MGRPLSAWMTELVAADLLGAMAFADRMDQLDPIRVNDPEHRWSGQEDLGPYVMGPEEAQEAGTLGELGKQRVIVLGQPPIKRPVANAFKRMQEPQGDDLTGPEVSLGVFGDAKQMVGHVPLTNG